MCIKECSNLCEECGLLVRSATNRNKPKKCSSKHRFVPEWQLLTTFMITEACSESLHQMYNRIWLNNMSNPWPRSEFFLKHASNYICYFVFKCSLRGSCCEFLLKLSTLFVWPLRHHIFQQVLWICHCLLNCFSWLVFRDVQYFPLLGIV